MAHNIFSSLSHQHGFPGLAEIFQGRGSYLTANGEQ
jgi:hypothetical protein